MDKVYWVALNFLRFEGARKKFESLFEDAKSGKSVENEIEEKFVNAASSEISRARSLNVNVITFENKNYPERLRNIQDPPVVLYVKGAILPQDNLSVSIVGSRKCTPYGRSIARKFSNAFAKAGITIISGLALGIDSEAHRGAISAKGRTIAVLGSGINRIYPSSNEKLAEKIASSYGAVISEFPLDTKPNKFNFPFRNRIISGISIATIVVEAAEKSGSLITARLAAEQGRDVFSVPGNITSKMSKGTNDLIKDGAIPITSPEDLFAYEKEFESLFREKESVFESLSNEERKILVVLENSAETVDQIAKKTGIAVDKIARIITYMEVKGLVKRSGGRYLKI